jgi:hypothetical protein|tara:strand:- start:529 stop:750 length:222 start_codon:yes stop_codon:yes gene_type:complete
MKFSLKKTFSKKNMLGVKHGINKAGQIGQKLGQVASATAPLVMLGGPEMAPIAAGIEAGGLAAQGLGAVLQTV